LVRGRLVCLRRDGQPRRPTDPRRLHREREPVSRRFQRGNIGHTDWTYANSIYDGFTTALPPNTKVLVAPGIDADVNTEDENNGGPTYAAVTARSYHPGGVNSLFGDGSVRFIKDSINWATWRAVGTIASGEIVSSDSY
jgi:prepilin-type processing-associated H-X9-DG protein